MILLFGLIRTVSAQSMAANTVRTLFTLLLFGFWMYTIYRRVLSRHISRFLLAVAGLEMFWVLVRFVKYEFVRSADGQRIFWYIYYLPITMIPALCLLLAISMGKPDTYKTGKALLMFPAFSLALFAVVITNDLHSLVFDIPSGYEGLAVGNYSYGAVYYVIMVYVGLCALASFGIIFVKCRAPVNRGTRLLPLLPIIIGIAGTVLYALGVETYFGVYKIDITLFVCVLTTITLEMCVQCRLIPTNSGYDELFRECSIRAVITDEDFREIIASNSYEPIDDLKAAESAPVMREDGFLLSCERIKRGRVLWQDDMTEINAVLSGLSESLDYLQGKNAAVRQMLEYQKKERRLIEKNRLYSSILSQTKPEIQLYAELIEQLEGETDPIREKTIAMKMALVCGFIKRRDNLFFISEEERRIAPSELVYCVNELLSALRLYGVSCSCSSTLERPLEFAFASALFENFYRVVYGIAESVSAVFVYLGEADGRTAVTLRVTFAEGSLPPIISKDINAREQDDGDWLVTIYA